jgi:carboxypeptidase D
MLLQQGNIGINSVGIINGIIDLVIQAAYYPDFAVNNTYNIKAYPDSVAAAATTAFYQPGGCRDQATTCRGLQAASDPNNNGNDPSVNGVCLGAVAYCLGLVYGPFETTSNRNPFDIGHTIPDSFPPPFATGYLNNAWVQRALGAAVNFTETSAVVNNAFTLTADITRGYTHEIATLLDAGVKVALLHGDRDMRANWFGGEAVSLAIPYGRAGAFAAAGYAPILVPFSPQGGLVRQAGSFSFARVFQAGHEMPYYQPAVALTLFARTVLGLDAATGLKIVTEDYSTAGPKDVRNVTVGPPAPAQGPVECYVDAPSGRCTGAQIAALAAGTAVVNGDRIVVNPAA